MGDTIDFSNSEAKVIGWCVISSVKKYVTQESFERDEKLHLVTPESGYGLKNKTKVIYGWVVGQYERFGPDGDSTPFRTATRRMRSLFQMKAVETSQVNKNTKTTDRRGKGRKGHLNDNNKKKKRKKRF